MEQTNKTSETNKNCDIKSSENIDESKIIHRKTLGYEKPTIWINFTKLACQTGSVNLGQGFPDWNPPQFLLDALIKHISANNSNHQYTRTMGNVKLVEALAKTYNPIFNRELDPLSEILVANGAVSLLYNIITSLIHENEEMIVIEGFYDCYLPQAKFSGGKVVGVPLIPPKIREKSEYFNLQGNDKIEIKDKWEIDFEKLEAAFNERTKILILNTPHNPTGKILTFEEMHKIKTILDKFPNVILIMDEVYEYIIFDEFEKLPRFASLEGMWDRTVSVMSAGKIFSATGIRVGWAIGPKSIIEKATAVYQYNSFCLYDPIQLALADALESANLPYEGEQNYYIWMKKNYLKKRNYFVENLAKLNNFDLPFWLPEGGYFVIADISHKENEKKYNFLGDDTNNYTKDFNFILNLANEKKVVGIPLTPFYTEEHIPIGENFIRFAFCKKQETMDKALENLS